MTTAHRTLAIGAVVARLLAVASLPAAVTAARAGADSVHLRGQVGFIGEWAFTSTLDPRQHVARGGNAGYAGPLTMRHVGLCSASGPEEQTGEMTAAALRSGAVDDLTLAYGAESCVYSGPLSEEAGHFMQCAGGAQVPIRVWTTP